MNRNLSFINFSLRYIFNFVVKLACFNCQRNGPSATISMNIFFLDFCGRNSAIKMIQIRIHIFFSPFLNKFQFFICQFWCVETWSIFAFHFSPIMNIDKESLQIIIDGSSISNPSWTRIPGSSPLFIFHLDFFLTFPTLINHFQRHMFPGIEIMHSTIN